MPAASGGCIKFKLALDPMPTKFHVSGVARDDDQLCEAVEAAERPLPPQSGEREPGLKEGDVLYGPQVGPCRLRPSNEFRTYKDIFAGDRCHATAS